MKLIRSVPFTIALLLVLLIIAFVTGPLTGPSAVLKHVVGLDLETVTRREWWSLITAEFFADNLAQLVIVLLSAALGVGFAERTMGTRRTAVAFLVTGVVAAAIGVSALAVGVLAGEYWAHAVQSFVTVDALAPILGAVAASTAFISVLWRRRIRLVVFSFVLVFLLYSGQPTDFFRLLAVLVGLLLGTVFVGTTVRIEPWRSSHHESRVLFSSAAVIFALGPVLTLVEHGRFGLLSPLGVFISDGLPSSRRGGVPCSLAAPTRSCADQLAAHSAQGLPAVLLALLPVTIVLLSAYGLLRGRRAALYAVAAVAGADGLLAAFYFGVLPAVGNPSLIALRAGHSPEFGVWLVANAALPLVFATILLSQRRHFPIHADPRQVRRFALTVGVSAVATVSAYLVLGQAMSAQFRPAVGIVDLIAELPERFIPVSFLSAESHDFEPITFAARLLYHGVGPVFWLAVLIALVPLLRGTSVLEAQPGGREEYRQLLLQSGGSLSFPGTWAGNSYWFDDDRRMAIAYREVNGCIVTSGEPVGDPVDLTASLLQFTRYCDGLGATPVLYGVHAQCVAPLVGVGWSSVEIAEETVIDPAKWDMTGKKWQDVRSSVNRAARLGVHVIWTSWGELPQRFRSQIAEISESWVVEKALPEMGFTLGGLDELKDRDVVLALAFDEAGMVMAVTSWLPTWTEGVITGRTLDFMRRRADGMNGVMEFMIAEAAIRAQVEGLSFLSLSGAPLAMSLNEDRLEPLARVLASIGRSLEPVYGFRSLLAFKQKFQPRIVPVYLVYPDALALPSIAVAISRCYLPDLTLAESRALVRNLA